MIKLYGMAFAEHRKFCFLRRFFFKHRHSSDFVSFHLLISKFMANIPLSFGRKVQPECGPVRTRNTEITTRRKHHLKGNRNLIDRPVNQMLCYSFCRMFGRTVVTNAGELKPHFPNLSAVSPG